MDYTLETRDSANKLKGVLKEAYSCRYVQVGNEPSRLVFSYPADGIFASEIKRANLVWLKNEAGSILDKFHLQTKHSARSQDGFAYYEVDCQSLASQLADEIVDSIDVQGFENKTIAYVVPYVFANYQMNANPISVGSIDAVIGDHECEIVGENVSILELIKEMHNAVGGYYYVDKDRKFYWKAAIGEDKGQQLRYAKNLKGIMRNEDYSSIVTRLYYYGAGIASGRTQNKLNLKDDAGQANYYLDSDTQGTYGIIVKVLTDFTIASGEVLLAVAQQYLADHKNPIINYTIDFADLSELPDGISFDKLQLGSKVKVIDEDLGIDVETYIIKIDKSLDHPENTEIELSTVLVEIVDDLVSVYRKQSLLDGGNAIVTNLDTMVIKKDVYFRSKWTTDLTAISGDFIRTGKIQSNNWGAGAGTEIDLTGETIKIGGSAAPKFKWEAGALTIEGTITILNPGDINYDDIGEGTAYKRVSSTDISDGHIHLISDVVIDQDGALADKLVQGINASAQTVIEPGKIRLRNVGNLIANPGFEDDGAVGAGGDISGWTGENANTSVDTSHIGGAYSARILVATTEQALESEISIRCEADEVYTATCQAVADAGTNANGSLQLTWRDANQAYISNNAFTIPIPDAWTRYKISAKPPATACYVNVKLTVGANAAPAGAYHFDDVELTRSSQIIVQGDPAGARIEITPELLAGYSDATTKQFYLESATGKAMAGGGVVVMDAAGIHTATSQMINTGLLIDQDIANGAAVSATYDLLKDKVYSIIAWFTNMTDTNGDFETGLSGKDSLLNESPSQYGRGSTQGRSGLSFTFYAGPTSGADIPFIFLQIINNTGATKHFHGGAKLFRLLG